MKPKQRKKRATHFKKHFLRFFLWLFLFFIVLFIIALLILQYYYPQDQLKILLTEKVIEITGRNFHVEDLSFHPLGRLDIQDLELGFDPSENMS